MPLFFCKWEDRASLLVDDVDKDRAAEVAREVAEGRAPLTIRELPPRFFVAEVFFESEDDDTDPADLDPDGEALMVEPLPHVDEALAKLHDEDIPAVLVQPAAAPATPAVVEGDGMCTSEAAADVEGGGERVVRCTRKLGHEGPHSADDLVWDA